MAKLEEQRDEQTKRNLTLFQASCRGYLARQAVKKRKVGRRHFERDGLVTVSPSPQKHQGCVHLSSKRIYRNFHPNHHLNERKWNEFTLLHRKTQITNAKIIVIVAKVNRVSVEVPFADWLFFNKAGEECELQRPCCLGVHQDLRVPCLVLILLLCSRYKS